jgi:hypothetical protein
VLTLVTDVGANTTLVNNLLLGLQIFGRSLTAVEASITTLRTDVDANTLSNTQFLNALQFQSTSIFAIDTAIQGLNVQVGNLETTYNAHIDGAFLTIRQNVDSNNLILGTLSTHTTSLLTAMTQVVPRVDNNEFNVITNQNAISTLGTATEANRINFQDLETRIENLEAA